MQIETSIAFCSIWVNLMRKNIKLNLIEILADLLYCSLFFFCKILKQSLSLKRIIFDIYWSIKSCEETIGSISDKTLSNWASYFEFFEHLFQKKTSHELVYSQLIARNCHQYFIKTMMCRKQIKFRTNFGDYAFLKLLKYV